MTTVQKIFLSSGYVDDYSTNSVSLITPYEIQGTLNERLGFDGYSKKSLINIAGEDYLVKNHSFFGYDDGKKSSFFKSLQRGIGKRIGHAIAGTRDIRYRFIGTPASSINLMSIKEVLASMLLTAVEISNSKDGSPPFHTARMRLLIDNYPGTKQPRFRLLSKKMDFIPLNQFIYSAKTNKFCPPYQKKKDPYAILNQNMWPKTIEKNEKKVTVNTPIDEQSLAYAAILPAIFADYDLPGSHGKNFGVNPNDNKLSFFDFGHSLSSDWLRRTDVTTDLKPQDSYIGGTLNQQKLFSLTKPANLIRRYRGQHVVNAPLEDKIQAFRNVYNTFIDPSTGKATQLIANIKYESTKILHSLFRNGVISYKEEKYYRQQGFKSINLFLKRLKHIEKVLEPRLKLSHEELRTLEMLELISSKIIPTPLSKTGFIIHNDKPISRFSHRNTFEFKDNDIITTSKEATEQIVYFINRQTGSLIKPKHKNGVYHIPLKDIPNEWKVSPYSHQGAHMLNDLLNNNRVARDIYNKHQLLFTKEGGAEQTSQEEIDCFVQDVIEAIDDIKKTTLLFHQAKDVQQKLIFQFLDTACHGPVNSVETYSDKEKHANLWEVIHQLCEKDKNPRSSIEITSSHRLRFIEKQYAPEQFVNMYELSGSGHSKQA